MGPVEFVIMVFAISIGTVSFIVVFITDAVGREKRKQQRQERKQQRQQREQQRTEMEQQRQKQKRADEVRKLIAEEKKAVKKNPARKEK